MIGGKSLVNINGAKFISKNGGKTLRRLSTNGNVVSINGNYFVAKNRGKTIKRVSESSFSKLKSTPSTQSTGVRLARYVCYSISIYSSFGRIKLNIFAIYFQSRHPKV